MAVQLIAWPYDTNSLETRPHFSNNGPQINMNNCVDPLALGRLPTKFDLLPTTKLGLATVWRNKPKQADRCELFINTYNLLFNCQNISNPIWFSYQHD